jgi:hypothetical protein
MKGPLDQIPPEAVLGTFADCDALIERLRERATELGLTYRVIDELAGFGEAYTGKLLGAVRAKAMTISSMLALAGALGVKAVLVADAEMTARMRPRWESRDGAKVHSRRQPRLGTTTLKRILPAAASEMGRRGGKARMAALTPEERRLMGRRGAAVRWGHRTLVRAGDVWVDPTIR